jgi:hypothetical protein
MRVVSLITTVLDRHQPDVTFIDETGLGGPIADRVVQLGYNAIGVNFGSTADDPKKYRNKVAEMWWRMREWVMNAGAIMEDTQLELELAGREYGHNEKDQLVLERKDDMKKRIGCSPDWADALALTFAFKVPKRRTPRGELDSGIGMRENLANTTDYDPLDNL